MEILIGLVFAALAAGVCFGMARLTNREIEQEACGDVSRYAGTVWTYALLAGVALVSALCGAQLFRHTVSILAAIQISVCYFAVLAAAVIDLKLRIIPNLIPITLIGTKLLIFVYELLIGDAAFVNLLMPVVGCLLCGLFLLLGNRLSKNGIGGGDVKLLAAMGFLLGLYAVFTTLVIALIICSVFAVAVMLTKKMTIKQSVPFGPFIYAGYALMCLLLLY